MKFRYLRDVSAEIYRMQNSRSLTRAAAVLQAEVRHRPVREMQCASSRILDVLRKTRKPCLGWFQGSFDCGILSKTSGLNLFNHHLNKVIRIIKSY